MLEQCHEVRIRWAAPADHAIPAPFVSRVPSGLHVFFTPHKSGEEVNICPLIQTLFGKELKCHSTLESFSRPPLRSETFASAASYQYFHVLPDLSVFREYLHDNACRSDLKARLACEDEAQFAEYAASVDIDFDTISRAVNIAATWSADVDSGERPGSGITNRAIVKFRENHRYEVGILQSEKADEIEELSLGGYLAVLGENDSPSKCTVHRNSKKPLTRIIRRNHVLVPLAPSSSSGRALEAIVRRGFPTPYRPSPQARSHLPSSFSQAASAFLRPTCISHPAVGALRRPLPVLRRTLPRVAEPQSPACPQRRTRPRSARLDHQVLGLSCAIRALVPRRRWIRERALDRYYPDAPALREPRELVRVVFFAR